MLRGTASRRVVAVFSDAHGRENRALEVLMRLNACGTPADAVFFLGDGLRGFQHALSGAFPLTAVRGNCDGSLYPCFDDDGNEIPEERQVTVGSFRVLLMHGHAQEVKSHIGRAARCGLAADADVVLFGHTHAPLCERMDDPLLLGMSEEEGKALEAAGRSLANRPLYLFNPGALCLGSFGLLTVQGNEILLSHGTV